MKGIQGARSCLAILPVPPTDRTKVAWAAGIVPVSVYMILCEKPHATLHHCLVPENGQAASQSLRGRSRIVSGV